MLKKKYEELNMAPCFLSFVSASIAASGTTILAQTVDRGIDFYPRELIVSSWQSSAVTFVQLPFLLSTIEIGNSINRLYGSGIYSDMLRPVVAGQTTYSLPFTGLIKANTNVKFTVQNLSAVTSIISMLLIGESKPV